MTSLRSVFSWNGQQGSVCFAAELRVRWLVLLKTLGNFKRLSGTLFISLFFTWCCALPLILCNARGLWWSLSLKWVSGWRWLLFLATRPVLVVSGSEHSLTLPSTRSNNVTHTNCNLWFHKIYRIFTTACVAHFLSVILGLSARRTYYRHFSWRTDRHFHVFPHTPSGDVAFLIHCPLFPFFGVIRFCLQPFYVCVNQGA